MLQESYKRFDRLPKKAMKDVGLGTCSWPEKLDSNPCIFYTNIIFQRQFSFTSVFGCTIQTFAIDAYPLPHILNYCSPGTNMNRVNRMKIAYAMHRLQDRGQVGSMHSKYKHQTSSNIRINIFFPTGLAAILQRPPGFCCPILSGCLNCLSALEISEKGPQKTSAASHP